jgi:hypothetical protein
VSANATVTGPWCSRPRLATWNWPSQAPEGELLPLDPGTPTPDRPGPLCRGHGGLRARGVLVAALWVSSGISRSEVFREQTCTPSRTRWPPPWRTGSERVLPSCKGRKSRSSPSPPSPPSSGDRSGPPTCSRGSTRSSSVGAVLSASFPDEASVIRLGGAGPPRRPRRVGLRRTEVFLRALSGQALLRRG